MFVIVPDTFLGKPQKKGWVISYRVVQMHGLFGWKTGLDVQGYWAALNMSVLESLYTEIDEEEMQKYYPQILDFLAKARAKQRLERQLKAKRRSLQNKLAALKEEASKRELPLVCQRQETRKKSQK